MDEMPEMVTPMVVPRFGMADLVVGNLDEVRRRARRELQTRTDNGALNTSVHRRLAAQAQHHRMSRASTFLTGFQRRADGATSVEYALIACLISIAIIGGGAALGSAVNAKFVGASAAVSAVP